MRQIKFLKKHRWFIWAIVVSVAGLGFLATYVYDTAEKDAAKVPVIIKPQENVVTSKVKASVPISQSEAAYLVRNIPQVQDYLKNHSRARVTPDDLATTPTETPYWPVHVYEDFKDHTKTFDWFYVYMESGVIVRK